MVWEDLELPGLRRLVCRAFRDERGMFVKTFHSEMARQAGVSHTVAEAFYSSTARGVVRGMHFQIPPHDHSKMVYCAAGRVMDVVVDVRQGSPTLGRYHAEVLEADHPVVLFIPSGFAHGFQSLEDGSLVFYSVSTVHHPDADRGIRWDSFGFTWPEPITGISDRDRAHPCLADWKTPFVYLP